jgi:hypothetical protein
VPATEAQEAGDFNRDQVEAKPQRAPFARFRAKAASVARAAALARLDAAVP